MLKYQPQEFREISKQSVVCYKYQFQEFRKISKQSVVC